MTLQQPRDLAIVFPCASFREAKGKTYDAKPVDPVAFLLIAKIQFHKLIAIFTDSDLKVCHP